MTSTALLPRIARWCATHRLATVAVWIGVVVAISFAASAAGSRNVSSARLPGTETQRVHDLLAAHFPVRNGDVDQLVFAARKGTLRDPAARLAVSRALDEVRREPIVAHVDDPLRPGGQLTRSGTVGVADVQYREAVDDTPATRLRAVRRAAFDARSPDLQVEHGGAGAEKLRGGGGSEELIGLAAAALVLLLTFGSLAAAGMPLITALLSLAGSLGAIGLLSHVMDTPEFASELATLIGIGVGVDYALFVLARYRSELDDGRDRLGAIERAAATAGRTVFHAGGTVVVALLGLLLLGLPFLHGVAVGAAIAVLATMIGALTLLPALLATFGRFVEPRRRRRAHPVRRGGAGWARWARTVQRRPVVAVVVAGGVLLALCAPVLGMRLGSSDASVDPPASSPFKAQRLISDAFGPGVNGPLLVAMELPRRGDTAAATRTADLVRRAGGIAGVDVPRLSPDGRVATFTAVATTGPQEARTTTTLRRLREDVLPAARRETGAQAGVGGWTAANQDFTTAIAGKLPLFVGAVVGLSALMLLLVFRSIAIPLKAAAFNGLSIGAALGLVTLVFQHGVGADPLGIGTGPIEPFVPVLTFAIVFGLSMDYEIFLLSRIREAWVRSGDASDAVVRGLAGTGRVITAAAAIMVTVFATFVLADDRVVKMFGVGLAGAILIDALVIRCVLVPAVLGLLGRRAWWLPAPLARWLPPAPAPRTRDAAPAPVAEPPRVPH